MKNSFSLKIASLVKRTLTPNRPYHAQWLITPRCNYRCRGCQVWRHPANGAELPTEDVKRGLDILRKLGVLEITFSGGNPLLREDIGEILDYASRYFFTTVYDNGSIAVEKIDALHNVDFVAISLDSLHQERHNYVKGVPGAWNQAVKAIDMLEREGICVEVSPTISQLNLHEIVELTEHFVDRGVPVCYCLYWYDNPGENQLFRIGKRTDELEITDPKTLAAICDALRALKKERGILITTQTLSALKQFFLTGQRSWTCEALRSFLTVDFQGKIAGCHLQEPVASIFDLPEAWDSPTFESLRQTYSECNKCAYLCYIFYSIHGSVEGTVRIIHDQWKNALALLIKRAGRSRSMRGRPLR